MIIVSINLALWCLFMRGSNGEDATILNIKPTLTSSTENVKTAFS